MATLNDIETQLDTIIEILTLEQENNTMLHQILDTLTGGAGENDGNTE